MHLKSTNESAKSDVVSKKSTTATTTRIMATVNDEDNHSRLSNNNNNNNNDDNNSTNTTQLDEAEIKLKKQTLEQRKQELEKLLSEKSWLLQQIQKQETQILNGNLEYLNINEIFATLAQQYKQQEQVGVGGGGGGGSGSSSAILRRKTASKENHNINSTNNNNNNRQSEISNRSSEYDNYPGGGGGGGGGAVETHSIGGGVGLGIGVGVAVATQQLPAKNATALKKRATPTPTANINYVQLQRQQQLLQQQYQYAAMAQQQQQQKLLQHAHFHQQPQQQQQQKQQQQHQQRHYLTQPLQIDAISLYSVNSTNVATLRQQHISPQQQPIVVQCDKYYLSPTHQSYNDGGFIKSSQNIKKYISPMSSPTQHHLYEIQQPQQHQQIHQHQVPLQQLQMHTLHPQSRHHQLDAISLAPSYISVDMDSSGQNTHNIRWRSQTSIPPHLSPQHHQQKQDIKSHSSDMLAHIPSTSSSSTMNYYSSPVLQPPPPPLPPPSTIAAKQQKPLDEISISSLNSETQKKSKPKQWLESSLDGPVIRSQSAALDSQSVDMSSNVSASVRLPTHVKSHHHSHHGLRERGAKLSSQSMSSGRHYSMSAQKNPHTTASKLLQDDDGRYAKLSQSTSYLHTMADTPQVSASSISPAYHLDATPIDIPPVFRYLPPKPSSLAGNSGVQPTPPPRPPPFADKLTIVTSPQHIVPIVPVAIGATSSLSPEIRIESPQNMTIVQQATFQPYKEETKPFEMSDFYKYSTKFRQKDTASVAGTNQMDH